MKKLALAMVFVLLMALFIAFNYLLWDRDNREAVLKDLQSRNADIGASVSAKDRDIKNLEEENSTLQEKISQLENEKTALQQGKDQMSEEKDLTTRTLDDKIASLNVLKQLLDIKQLEIPVVKWTEAIDAGKYEDAYKLEYDNLSRQEKVVSQVDYSDNLKETVKNISIKSIGLDAEKGSDTGEIYLSVSLDVKLVENADTTISRFDAGLNEMSFKLDYSMADSQFIIKEIT